MIKSLQHSNLQLVATLCFLFFIGVLDYAYQTGYDTCILGESSRDSVCINFRSSLVVILIMVISYGQSVILMDNQVTPRNYIKFVLSGLLACWFIVLFTYYIYYMTTQEIPLLFDKFVRFKLSAILERILPVIALFYFLVFSLKPHTNIINNYLKSIRLRMIGFGVSLIVLSIVWYFLKNSLMINYYYFHLISQNFLITFGVHFPFFLFISSLFIHIFIKRNNKCIAEA